MDQGGKSQRPCFSRKQGRFTHRRQLATRKGPFSFASPPYGGFALTQGELAMLDALTLSIPDLFVKIQGTLERKAGGQMWKV